MHIAFISDIHANITALRAVFDRLEDESPDVVVCTGDIVGYGPSPADCVELVREQFDVVVAGNHDRTVETPELYAGHATAVPGLEHAAAALSDDQLRWLRNLPDQAIVEDTAVAVTHSHPNPDNQGQYVYPDSFTQVANQTDAEVLVLGHTHVQGTDETDSTIVVNPGSVGQPRDCDPKAAFALLDTYTQSVDLCRVDYDIDAVRTAVKEAGLPEQTWRRLQDGT